jgi:hypothetical protein
MSQPNGQKWWGDVTAQEVERDELIDALAKLLDAVEGEKTPAYLEHSRRTARELLKRMGDER